MADIGEDAGNPEGIASLQLNGDVRGICATAAPFNSVRYIGVVTDGEVEVRGPAPSFGRARRGWCRLARGRGPHPGSAIPSPMLPSVWAKDGFGH